MRRRILTGLLALLLLLTACAAQPEELRDRPQIRITLLRGKGSCAPAELLMDGAFRQELEERLEVSIVLEEVWDSGSVEESEDIAFTGGLITGDCYRMVPMASGYQLERLEDLSGIPEPQYGRLGSAVYSYVFSVPDAPGEGPVLVADLGCLKEAGVDRVPFTEEGFHSLLVTLSSCREVPLAVYGNPAGEGFGCLLSLFGLSPTGGREFYLMNGEICFDKISDQAERYLRYGNRLYSEGLICADCLSLNEYACRNLFLSGKAAMAMFPNGTSAEAAVTVAREQGIEAVAVELPVPAEMLCADTYDRPIGLISYDYPHAGLLLQIYGALQERLRTVEPAGLQLQTHALFTASALPTPEDPLAELLPEIGLLYKKNLLDRAVIEPYYARLITGALPMESGFPELQQEWLNVYAQQGEAPAELSGANVMQIINGWYYKDQKGR